MNNKFLIGILVIITLGFSACVSKKISMKLTQEMMETASEVLGTNQFITVSIPASENEIANQTFIGLSKSAGPSSMSKSIAKLFSQGEVEPTPVVIFGASDAKTKQVLLDALSLNKQKNLSKLQIVYFGSRDETGEIKALAQKLGVQYSQQSKIY